MITDLKAIKRALSTDMGEGNKLQTGIEQRAEGIVLFTEQNDKGSNTETWDGFTRTQTFLIAYAQMNNPEKSTLYSHYSTRII